MNAPTLHLVQPAGFDFDEAFPIIPGTKKPAVKWLEPANCRPTETFPEGETYGLPTGPRNGILVIDQDVKNGVDGIAALDQHAASIGQALPETYAVRTPSGGPAPLLRLSRKRDAR